MQHSDLDEQKNLPFQSSFMGLEYVMALPELLVTAILPCLILLWFIIKKDRYEKEPFRMLLGTFILGALAIIPALTLELALSKIIPRPENSISDAAGLVLHNLIVIAAVEESCKLLAALPAYRSKVFNEPLDGVVYATTASMGFATIENIFYVVSGGWLVAIFRAGLSVPGHAFFGATMGFYLGRARFSRIGSAAYALVVPIILHTIYNVIVTLGLGLLSLLLGAGFIILLYRRIKRQIAIADRASPFRTERVRYCIYCGSELSYDWLYCPKCGRSQATNNQEQF